MKKLGFILVLLLASYTNVWSYKLTDIHMQQEFVNPIFNKLLIAYSRTSWNTILTPNSISESPDDFSSPDAHIEKHNCKLQENEQEHIKYICNVCYQDISAENKTNCSLKIIVYKITDDGFIEKQSFSFDGKEPYLIEFLETKP